jgi:hypothetical protein
LRTMAEIEKNDLVADQKLLAGQRHAGMPTE